MTAVPQSSGRLRAGVVGLGWAGQQHLDGYARAAGVELVGLAGMEPEHLERLGDQYGIEHRYADWADLVANAELDVISVCTPPSLHAPITIAALEAGIHVLSEKPMALDSISARQMVDAAKANGRILDVSFNHRRKAEVAAAKDLIDRGLLGRIYYAKAGWMRHSGIPGLGSWFTRKATSGGGPMMDIGVHMLDMALHLMGEPTVRSVSAATYAEFGPRGRGGSNWGISSKTGGDGALAYEVEDLATAFVRMNDGGTLLLESSWAQGIGHDDMYVTLFGTEGGAELSWNRPDGPKLRAWTQIDGVDAALEPQIGPSGGHAEAIADFVAAVRAGDGSVKGEEALTRALIVDAAYRSAADGAEIRLEPVPSEALSNDAVAGPLG